MASLYEINQAILDTLDFETGEILDAERLNELQIERELKIEGVACWVKNLQAEATAYKAEKDVFAEREKAANAKVEKLKAWLAGALSGQKFISPRCTVSFRKSEQVQVDDETKVPVDYLNITVVKKPDKAAIKAAIKEGEIIDGCRIIENTNTQVK